MLGPKNYRRNQKTRTNNYYVIGGVDADNSDEWEVHTVAYHADSDFVGIRLEELPIKGSGIPAIRIDRRIGVTDSELIEIPLSTRPPIGFFAVDYFGSGFEDTGNVYFNDNALGWTVVVKRYAGMGRVPRSPQKNQFVQNRLRVNKIHGNETALAGSTQARLQLAWKEIVTANVDSKFTLVPHGISGGKSRIIRVFSHYRPAAPKFRMYEEQFRVTGKKWQNALMPAESWRAVCFGGGKFVAVGFKLLSYDIAYSTDGVNWTGVTSPQTSNGWASVAYGNGVFVAVTTAGTKRVMTSPDGITWTLRNVPESNSWTSVCFGNGIFMAVSTDGFNRAMSSPDGITWTARNLSPAANAVAYGNGVFVAVSTNFAATSADDGVTWTTRTAANANQWFSLAFGDGYFVAVAKNNASGNQVMRSADGITWTAHAAGEYNVWQALSFGDSMFVAVADEGTGGSGGGTTQTGVMYSTDGGQTWTVGFSASGPNGLTGVCFGAGVMFVVVASGTYLSNADPATDYVSMHTLLRFWDDTNFSIVTDIPDGASVPREVYSHILYLQETT